MAKPVTTPSPTRICTRSPSGCTRREPGALGPGGEAIALPLLHPLGGAEAAGDALGLLAQAEDLVAMAGDVEAEAVGHPLLQGLDLVVLELDDVVALLADEMVVVRPLPGHLVQGVTG